MSEPNNHSIAKPLLELKPGDWRLFITIRRVSDKNKRQADEHLRVCNNKESLDCKCHEVS